MSAGLSVPRPPGCSPTGSPRPSGDRRPRTGGNLTDSIARPANEAVVPFERQLTALRVE
ncbi:hypothetical protein ACWD4G_41860 [Streptomyces sp. NPDC002643]